MVKFLIQRPIAVTVTFIAILVMSLVAAGLIPVSLMPEVDIPEIVIKMSVPEKPAREMEEQYVGKLRRQLLQVSHLKDIESNVSNGQGYIRLLFDYGTNINYAFIEVNEKVDAMMHSMPDEFSRPRVIKTSATDIPVFYLNVSLKDSLDQQRFMELSEFCEQVIKKRVEQLPEVAMADITGTELPEIILQVDMERLNNLGINRSTIINALKSNNYSVGNIKVRSGLYEFNVRYASLLKNRSDIENLYISVNERVFKLKELAKIKVRSKLGRGIYLANKKRSVVMAVIKKSNVRIADLKQNSNDLIELLRKDYPRLQFNVERNQTDLLDYSIGNLEKGLLIGGFLAFIIMFLFLKDIKSPLLIGLSIPVSLAISLLFFFLFGISINIISLSGLILGVGMMIDNSIIVIDNIVQHREKSRHEAVLNKGQVENFKLDKACIDGTNEVIRPLISSVLTTCAVFVPLIFISGISGALFYDQAMAVAIGLFVSLLVSFSLIPVYFRIFYRRGVAKKAKVGFFSSFMNKINLYSSLENSYSRGFDFVFYHKIAFFMGAFFLIIVGYFVLMRIEKEKFPVFQQNEAVVSIDWNKNITVQENHKRVDTFLALNDSLLQNSSCMIGEQDFVIDRSNKLGDSEAQLYLKTSKETELDIVLNNFKTFCKSKYPEAIVTISPPETIFEKVFSNQTSPLEIRLKNRNGKWLPKPEEINEISTKVRELSGATMMNKLRLQNYFEIKPNYERLLLYRVGVGELISVLKKAFNRLQIFTLKQGQYQVPIYMSGQEKSLYEILQSTKVHTQKGQLIPITSLVSVSEHTDYKMLKGGKSDIFVALNYDVSEKQSKEIVDFYTDILKSYPHIKIEVAGSLMQNKTLFMELLIILFISLLLLYFILAAQFESLLQPFIVLIEIPIDIAGALILLWLTGNSLNLMAFIGLIVMTGIIINDSILKIDTINKFVKKGYSIMEAIHLGGKTRLKPIIMTSATTILAMIPFLFGNDMGSRLQQPLAWSIIGGMTIGTLVSLYFIPLCYYYMMRKRNIKTSI